MTTEKKILLAVYVVAMSAAVGVYAFYMKRLDDRAVSGHRAYMATLKAGKNALESTKEKTDE